MVAYASYITKYEYEKERWKSNQFCYSEITYVGTKLLVRAF